VIPGLLLALTPGLPLGLIPGLPLGLTPGLPLGLTPGLPLGSQPYNPFALVASPKLGLRHYLSGPHLIISSYKPERVI
jgi:hypothetical protein